MNFKKDTKGPVYSSDTGRTYSSMGEMFEKSQNAYWLVIYRYYYPNWIMYEKYGPKKSVLIARHNVSQGNYKGLNKTVKKSL